jgi:predicted metal-dependent hydrolase
MSNNNDMVYVKSDIDGNTYLVRNLPDKQYASNTLSRIKQRINTLTNYLYSNKSNEKNKKYEKYIELLKKKIKYAEIIESSDDGYYTSYSVNKGEQLVFCLRSRKHKNDLHDINLMMYVVLHEISHVACPIYDNHGPLFKDIFSFITQNAIDLQLYMKNDFQHSPTEYCGLIISDSII